MPKCLFERSSGKYIRGRMYDDLPHDPTTHVQIELPQYPSPSHRWDGASGIRDATSREVADEEAAKLDRVARLEVNGTNKLYKLLFDVLFSQENRLRALEGLQPMTRDQLQDVCVARYKALVVNHPTPLGEG